MQPVVPCCSHADQPMGRCNIVDSALSTCGNLICLGMLQVCWSKDGDRVAACFSNKVVSVLDLRM